MYVMLLFGMIASALLFGAFLADFSPDGWSRSSRPRPS